MIFYQIKLEDDKIKILDVIDRDERPKDGVNTMYVNLEEMNKFKQNLVECEYSQGIDKFL